MTKKRPTTTTASAADNTKKSAQKEEVKKPVETKSVSVVSNPVPTAPEVPKEVAYVPKPLELSRKPSNLANSLGLPKSKKPWKALSERSGKHKKMNPKTWQQKMDDKRKLKAIRQRVKEEREKRFSSVSC